MVYRKISTDLKEAALKLKAQGRDTLEEIREITGISLRTLYRAQQQKQLTGSAAPALPIGCGRPQTLLRRDAEYLLSLAQHRPTLFLNEYAKRVEVNCEISVSITTIHRTLERAGLNVKHI
ncbi:hypothetical protein CVT24_001450 [Panaeolus cyanescens]|uniref:Resolvase HTH domain-containing protein n=1 Tax=Panaeolus cyanescens TaxID=181874 RepID=A0A409WY10_9AGAR|nr:hypothetical protein CVT24_001450 [Panaeolus cyanescens]